jgi:general secretion pathway protein G
MSKQSRKNRGFTLIEVMVVIAILGILATLVVPRVMNRPDEAREVKAQSDLAAIESALDLYRLDNGIYPTTEQGLEALTAKPTQAPVPRIFPDGGYMRRLPQDPWGNNYIYIHQGPGSFDLLSFGADGREGGEGINADISLGSQ